MRVALIAGSILNFLFVPAQAQTWVNSTGGRSCEETCGAVQKEPALAGNYYGPWHSGREFQGAGKFFTICAAEAEGLRPGYNLNNSPWREKCWVGYNSNEVGVPEFKCLCEHSRGLK